ncbi:hypothetical protein C8R45DRAFT_929721 [Mycena sanguinolenta]|nr:hypothetical protein C8R45DRAFT_929721 [Mycena sanguinolenta]
MPMSSRGTQNALLPALLCLWTRCSTMWPRKKYSNLDITTQRDGTTDSTEKKMEDEAKAKDMGPREQSDKFLGFSPSLFHRQALKLCAGKPGKLPTTLHNRSEAGVDYSTAQRPKAFYGDHDWALGHTRTLGFSKVTIQYF